MEKRSPSWRGRKGGESFIVKVIVKVIMAPKMKVTFQEKCMILKWKVTFGEKGAVRFHVNKIE